MQQEFLIAGNIMILCHSEPGENKMQQNKTVLKLLIGKRKKSIQGKDYVVIKLVKLIKQHDLQFVPKRIEVTKEGIILWREKKESLR
jgi:hypothetical protein